MRNKIFRTCDCETSGWLLFCKKELNKKNIVLNFHDGTSQEYDFFYDKEHLNKILTDWLISYYAKHFNWCIIDYVLFKKEILQPELESFLEIITPLVKQEGLEEITDAFKTLVISAYRNKYEFLSRPYGIVNESTEMYDYLAEFKVTLDTTLNFRKLAQAAKVESVYSNIQILVYAIIKYLNDYDIAAMYLNGGSDIDVVFKDYDYIMFYDNSYVNMTLYLEDEKDKTFITDFLKW